ncbi:MAG: hypothetical protein K1Y01_17865 [Vicinamibacteria bacterium]|nr:hypothetical protein [Vicinamibacteria bacterium]
MVKAPDAAVIEPLQRRFRGRLALGLSLARAYRFVVELEPFLSEGPDPFVELASVFKEWRQALAQGEIDQVLDAVERSWSLLEACRQRVVSRDAAIEAYRVRWACENAPLHHRTIDSLARFYRLLPFSVTSQSKYEYVLTRRLAGPIGPERKVAPTEVLEDAVVALERTWAAVPVSVDDDEVARLTSALKAFSVEAAAAPDAASFTSSALLRRFSALKISLGPKLFNPRLSVAVVETNVKVLNSWNQLLADAGGQPLRGQAPAGAGRMPVSTTPAEASRPEPSAPLASLLTETPPQAAPSPASADVPRDDQNLLTGEIDISGLEVVRAMRRRHATGEILPPLPPPAAGPEAETASGAAAEPVKAEAPSQSEAAPEAPPAATERPDLKTGEVDLSGLEFVRRMRARGDAGASASPEEGEAEGGAGESSASGEYEGHSADAEQLPSVRAYELGKLEENAAIVERYLTGPRSPEVWQLDLDVFLARSHGGVLNSEANAAERRRALELILDSDDLICARALQDDAPSAEHRAQVRAVASAMLLLRTSLRRSADLAQGNPAELEPLLYVADHLLWERLRLEASLKRRPSRPPRHLVLPRTNQAAEAALARTRSARRQRRTLVRVVAVAAAITTIAGLLSVTLPRELIDPEVKLVQVSGLPGAALFDDARMFRTTLFVSVSRTWTLLSREERRSIVSGLGAFAAERGLDAVSVVGPKGEPYATFKDDEVLLDGDLSRTDMAAR